jgi:hypothetical protein
LNLTVTATDNDLPSQALTFGLAEGPSGMTVTPSGLVNWTPTAAQSPSTNVARVFVSDGLASVTNQFNVVVGQTKLVPTLPVDGVKLSGGIPSFTFPTLAGYEYRLLFQNELSGPWFPLIRPPQFTAPNGWSAPASGATLTIDDPAAMNRSTRFYRLEISKP